MSEGKFKIITVWRVFLVTGILMLVSIVTGPVMGAESAIDPEADKILKSMSSYLGKMQAFSMNADIDFEIVTREGQKLQLSSFATVVVNRPEKFNIQRRGMIADAAFVFDGKILTLHGRNLNAYRQFEVAGTIGDAIRVYETETGIPAPGADLLFPDSYAILSSGVQSGIYVGVAYVNGVACHHLAFREEKVDWQLWVREGDKPLPVKYVITTKWHTGAPQYEIRLRDWDENPVIKSDQFIFSIPDGAKRLDTISVNALGELVAEEER